MKRVRDSLVADLKLSANTPLIAGEVLYKSAGGSSGGNNATIDTLPRVLPNSYVISAKAIWWGRVPSLQRSITMYRDAPWGIWFRWKVRIAFL